MSKIKFKNVGQGDSIIIEWENEKKNKIGIIDCNLYDNRNPVVEYLNINLITEIEFIVLSHFHYDHFSGMPGLFKFCIENKIKINYFLHTLDLCVLDIYEKLIVSKKIEKAASDFFHYFDLLKGNITNDFPVNYHTKDIPLSDTLLMSFLGPKEKTASIISKQINRKVNTKEFSYSDINKFSTIIYLHSNSKGILFTSDSVNKNFKNLNEIIKKEINLIQVPHHGSLNNIHPNFWQSLQKIPKCPAVFSVGYEPKDKLPNKETVEFIDNNGYDVYSTNTVFGIDEYFNQNNSSEKYYSNSKTQILNNFSKKVKTIYRNPISNQKLEGDKEFSF